MSQNQTNIPYVCNIKPGCRGFTFGPSCCARQLSGRCDAEAGGSADGSLAPTRLCPTPPTTSMSTPAELDTVLARLAGMDDDKLEAPLAKLLPKLLSPAMVGAQDAALRGKVIQILTHINKRVKAAPELQLPVPGAPPPSRRVGAPAAPAAPLPPSCSASLTPLLLHLRAAALLGLYSEHVNTKALENNFIIMYLDFGVPRLPAAAKGALFGQLMRQIAIRPTGQQATLHKLLLHVAPHFALPTEEKARAEAVALFTKHSADLAYVRDYFMDVVLYFPVAAAPVAQAAAAPTSPAAGLQAAANLQNQARAVQQQMRQGPQSAEAIQAAEAARASAEAARTLTPGLSPERAKRVEGKAAPDPAQLTEWKLAVLIATKAFDGTEVLTKAQLLPLLLAASCDFNDEVCRKADDQLRGLGAV